MSLCIRYFLNRGLVLGRHLPLISTTTAEISTYPDIQINGLKTIPGDSSRYIQKISAQLDGFPHIVSPALVAELFSDGIELAGNRLREYLDLNLHKLGAVIYPGTPLGSAADFQNLWKALRYQAADYAFGFGGRDRAEVDKAAEKKPETATRGQGDIWHASNMGGDTAIEQHTEKAYTKYAAPTKLMLLCIQPATGGGGESLLLDTRRFQRHLSPDILSEFGRRGVRYVRWVPDKNNTKEAVFWQRVLDTDDKRVAEDKLRELDVEYQWTKDGTLETWENVPAFRNHPVTGRRMWFNQIAAMHESYYGPMRAYIDGKERKPNTTRYGDNGVIPEEVIQHLREEQWRHSTACLLRPGDLCIIDNYYAMHGRLAFEGQRTVFAALSAD